jgi:flagellar basal-body rod modification protein FlgD
MTTVNAAPSPAASLLAASSASASPLAGLAQTAATTQVGSQAGDANMNQFLTLLTAQLKNQDPMQPTDPTQFVAQLAQFSTVEQLVKGNTTLTGMSKAISGLSLGQYAGMINHTVTATTSSVTVPASGGVSSRMAFAVTAGSLANVHVAVTNSSGTAVGSLPVTGSAGSVTFDGTDANGQPLAAGQYGVSLVGTASDGTSQSAGTLTTSGTVAGVQQGASGAWQLQMQDGSTVDASSVQSAT